MINNFATKFMIIVCFSLLTFSCESSKGVKNSQLTAVEMTFTGMSGSTQIKAEKGKFKKVTTERNGEIKEDFVRKESGESKYWTDITNLVSEINLSEIENWEAPTQKRFYDGARGAVLKITFGDTEYVSQTFDEGEPMAEFKELYDYLVSVVNQ